jgi:sugar phosphate isomerase/epimerase
MATLKDGDLLASYYANPSVQARILEFLGGRTLDEASCLFVTGHGEPSRCWYDPQPINQLWRCVSTDQEIARLVLENMLPHLFFGHARDVLWILGAMKTVDVGICLDTGHAHLSGDLATVAHKLSGHLWMVHASDNRGQRDDHLPPGEGDIDWSRLFAQLGSLRFDGVLMLEIAGGGEVQESLQRARRSAAYLRNLVRQFDLTRVANTP